MDVDPLEMAVSNAVAVAMGEEPGVRASLRPQNRPGGRMVATKASFEPAPVAAAEVKELSPDSLPTGTRLVQLGRIRFTADRAGTMGPSERTFRRLYGRQRPHHPRGQQRRSDVLSSARAWVFGYCRRTALLFGAGAENTDCIPGRYTLMRYGATVLDASGLRLTAQEKAFVSRRKTLWVHSVCTQYRHA